MPPISKPFAKRLAEKLFNEGVKKSDLEPLITVKKELLQEYPKASFDKFVEILNGVGCDKLKQLAEDPTSNFRIFVDSCMTDGKINMSWLMSNLKVGYSYIVEIFNKSRNQFLQTINSNKENQFRTYNNRHATEGGKKKTSKKKVRKIHKGPRGGKYYISKGRKVYI